MYQAVNLQIYILVIVKTRISDLSYDYRGEVAK